MALAIEMVRDGMPKKKVARIYGVPNTTDENTGTDAGRHYQPDGRDMLPPVQEKLYSLK